MLMSKKYLTFYGIYGYQGRPYRIVADTITITMTVVWYIFTRYNWPAAVFALLLLLTTINISPILAILQEHSNKLNNGRS